MGNHFIEKCVCGNVLAQCRCPGPRVETIKGPCKCATPKPAGTGEARRWKLWELESGIVGSKDERTWISGSDHDAAIATLKKALDAVLESEEISDEAADDLEGENVKLRERVSESEEAVRKALRLAETTEGRGEENDVRLVAICVLLTRALKATEGEG